MLENLFGIQDFGKFADGYELLHCRYLLDAYLKPSTAFGKNFALIAQVSRRRRKDRFGVDVNLFAFG